MIKMMDIEWHHDPAASESRERAFLGDWQLIAYESGYWYVDQTGRNLANGRERDTQDAKARAFLVYEAFVKPLRPARDSGLEVPARGTP